MKSGFSRMAVGFSLLPFNLFNLSKYLLNDLPPFPTELVILGARCCVALLAGGLVGWLVAATRVEKAFILLGRLWKITVIYVHVRHLSSTYLISIEWNSE